MKYRAITLILFLMVGFVNVAFAKNITIKPTCDEGFEIKKDGKNVPNLCEFKQDEKANFKKAIKEILGMVDLDKAEKENKSKKVCADKSFLLNDTQDDCVYTTSVPTCGDVTGRVTFDTDTGECVQSSDYTKSDDSNLIGDCFNLKSNVPGVDEGIDKIVVVSESDNKATLSVMRAENKFWKFYCKGVPNVGTPLMQVNRDKLLRSGATRRGWVYGVLALPYKIYTKDRTLSSTSTTVGPYLGSRYSENDIAFTWALSVGLTQSNAFLHGADGKYVLGTDGNPIENKQTGITTAIGLMFDVSKSAKPLKVGIFYGRDYFGNKESGKIPHEGDNWVALQIGFDFTD